MAGIRWKFAIGIGACPVRPCSRAARGRSSSRRLRRRRALPGSPRRCRRPWESAPNALFSGLAGDAGRAGLEWTGIPTSMVRFYGNDGDGPMLPAPGDVQTPSHNVEASKTEPDKNTYLVVKGQHGADPIYDYGTHFLFQGHELRRQAATSRASTSTRIPRTA